jgi:nicotinamidase-related amidase
VTDCLLAVDLFSDFAFEGGNRLLDSMVRRRAGIAGAIAAARDERLPIVFANDTHGTWDGDAGSLVSRALDGPGGDVLGDLVPRDGDAFLVKPRYSAFDLTPLPLVLDTLGIERILIMGTATEVCVAQTAIDARERGYKVTVVTDACATGDPEAERIALEYLERVSGTYLAATVPDALALAPAGRSGP